MKNKNVRGILALAVVTALSFGVIIGSKALATDMEGENGGAAQAKVTEELDVSGAENIEKGSKNRQRLCSYRKRKRLRWRYPDGCFF